MLIMFHKTPSFMFSFNLYKLHSITVYIYFIIFIKF